MFQPCETRQCVDIMITDDLVNELHELFTFCLSMTSSPLHHRIELNPVDGEVSINDNDGEWK